MKIKYVHSSEPNVEKMYDTVKALKNNPFITLSQKEFDEFELQKIKRDKEYGTVLRYEILSESNGEEK